jgi:hypothetical protein
MFFSPAFFSAGSFFSIMYILKIQNKQGRTILYNNYRTMKEVTDAILSCDTTHLSIFISKRYGEAETSN